MLKKLLLSATLLGALGGISGTADAVTVIHRGRVTIIMVGRVRRVHHRLHHRRHKHRRHHKKA